MPLQAVEIAGSRTDYPEPYADFVTQPMDITLPSEIGIHTFSATAWDPSGNTAVATATINIIAAFDTTPPQVITECPFSGSTGTGYPPDGICGRCCGRLNGNLFC